MRHSFGSSTLNLETSYRNLLQQNCMFHLRVSNSVTDTMSRTNRNWRFHTDLKMWLTKDITLPEPMQLSLEKEQGSYVFFNQMAWEKVRVSDDRFLWVDKSR